MPHLYQMITKLEMSIITYVHTAQKETIPVNFVRMWRQFHGCPASGGGIGRVFFSVENSMMLSRRGPRTRPWKAH
jgi:hypothetical protein